MGADAGVPPIRHCIGSAWAGDIWWLQCRHGGLTLGRQGDGGDGQSGARAAAGGASGLARRRLESSSSSAFAGSGVSQLPNGVPAACCTAIKPPVARSRHNTATPLLSFTETPATAGAKRGPDQIDPATVSTGPSPMTASSGVGAAPPPAVTPFQRAPSRFGAVLLYLRVHRKSIKCL